MTDFEHFLSDEFSQSGGFEKIRTKQIQKRSIQKRLRDNYKKEYTPALPATTAIGDLVIYRSHLSHKNFTGSADHGFRPAYVYGLYYKRNRVVAVDLIDSSTSVNAMGKPYPSVFSAHTPEVMQKTRSAMPHCIKMSDIVTIPNRQEFFGEMKSVLGTLDASLWPELLVRRVDDIQYNARNAYRNNCQEVTRDSEVVRKGFAFSVVPLHAVRSRQVLPDMISNGLNHQETEVLPNSVVDLLGRWSNSYAKYQRSRGNHFFTFPPMDGQLANYPEAPFCNWDSEARPVFRPR